MVLHDGHFVIIPSGTSFFAASVGIVAYFFFLWWLFFVKSSFSKWFKPPSLEKIYQMEIFSSLFFSVSLNTTPSNLVSSLRWPDHLENKNAHFDLGSDGLSSTI
jgi:hypothetical protein